MNKKLEELVSRIHIFEANMTDVHNFTITNKSGHTMNPLEEIGEKEIYFLAFKAHGKFILYTQQKKIVHYTSAGEGKDVRAVATIVEGLKEIIKFIALSTIFEGEMER